jgi:WD40 repeat protein
MMAKRLQIGVLLGLLLAGCATDFNPSQPANVVLEHAHSGGSVVTFSADSTILASGGWEGDIHLWSVPEGKRLLTVPAHRDSVNGIGFLDATHLVSAGYDGRITLWDTSGKLLREAQTPSPIRHMVLDAQNRLVITGHKDGVVRLWRLPDLQADKEYPLHSSAVRAVAWHAASGQFASSGHDGRVFSWTADSAARELDEAPSDARTLQFSPDGRTLMGAGWFKLFRWDAASGALEVIPTEHHGIINSLRYIDDGKTLASISRQTDSAVYFLDAQSGAVLRRFQRHDLCGADVVVSPDKRYLATTSDDASVRLWDLQTPPLAAER